MRPSQRGALSYKGSWNRAAITAKAKRSSGPTRSFLDDFVLKRQALNLKHIAFEFAPLVWAL